MTDRTTSALPKLRPGEPLGRGTLRVGAELIDLVIARMEADGTDRSEDVHQIRTGLKRLRALVRLIRPGMTQRAANEELVVFRDAGRHFAPARDGYVLLHTIDTLAAEGTLTGPIDPALQATLERLRRDNTTTVTRILDPAGDAAGVAGSLRSARLRWGSGADVILPGGLVPGELADGLATTIRKGRKAMEAAREKPTPESLHEWRKRAKDLRYQVEIIAPVVLEIAHLEEPLIGLSDALGEDHDLAELAGAVATGTIDGAGTEPLLSGLARRQAELEQRAWDLGAAVYRSDPARLAARVEESLHGP